MDDEAKRKRAEYMKAWRAANKERVKENWRRWSEEHKDDLEHKARKRAWQVDNRQTLTDRERERRRNFAAAHPDEYKERKRAEQVRYAEQYAAYRQRYYAAHREDQIRAAREWQVANRERRQAYLREWAIGWREANPEKYRQQTRVANLRRRGDVIDLEYAEILLGDPCSYCGVPADTVDHIEPLFHGHEGSADNLTAACRSCNSSKRDRPLLRFLGGRLAESGSRAA